MNVILVEQAWTLHNAVVVTKTWNDLKDLKPPKTIYNNQQPPTTIYNHLKNIYNHL